MRTTEVIECEIVAFTGIHNMAVEHHERDVEALVSKFAVLPRGRLNQLVHLHDLSTNVFLAWAAHVPGKRRVTHG